MREGGISAWGLVPAANFTRSDRFEEALLDDRREERGRSDGWSLGVPAPASRLRCMAAPDRDACSPSPVGLRPAAKEDEDGGDARASEPELECACGIFARRREAGGDRLPAMESDNEPSEDDGATDGRALGAS